MTIYQPRGLSITLHNEEEFEGMRKAGRLAAEVLDFITPYVKTGNTTDYLNTLCHDFIINAGAIPAPLNYKGFPKSICTSKNDVICHGIPDDNPLKDGDIMNIDVTVILDGWHGDTSRMYYVGKPTIKAQKLCITTYESLMLAIEDLAPGKMLNDIGRTIESYIAKHSNYSVVRDYCGHGLGKKFHSDPSVIHFANNNKEDDFELKAGMFFTIEPMINAGRYQSILNSKDGWTVSTRDMSLSAQFEHSIGITENGAEIFTLSPNNLHCPPYNV
ncbi:MAG: type I methionyl aminopeptidase [Anaplasmataceae bacterium]|nr:type I methionyl aminopeptidase [Anaplasmataceae bacterium]